MTIIDSTSSTNIWHVCIITSMKAEMRWCMRKSNRNPFWPRLSRNDCYTWPFAVYVIIRSGHKVAYALHLRFTVKRRGRDLHFRSIDFYPGNRPRLLLLKVVRVYRHFSHPLQAILNIQSILKYMLKKYRDS